MENLMKQRTDNGYLSTVTDLINRPVRPVHVFRNLFILLIVSSCVSCNNHYTVVEEKYPDGNPRRVCEYIGAGDKGELIKETFYYQNKQVEQVGSYKDSLRDGHWQYYYENGRLWSEGYFKEGKSDGKRMNYYENGNLRYEGYFRKGIRSGKWKFYTEEGVLVKEVDYPESKEPR